MSNKLSIFKMKGEVLEIIDNGARNLIDSINNTISNLKTVAFSGSYTDLTDTPTIPTVNNGTLTIQKNGEAVQTFSANQSGNATANITVPTTAGEISFNNTGTDLDANDVQNAITEINSNLSDVGTSTNVAVGAIGGSGFISHPNISNYRYLLVILRSGAYIAASSLVPLGGWNGGNHYAVQYYDEVNARHMTMEFAKTTDTSTYLTLVSTESYFSGWNYQIIGIK